MFKSGRRDEGAIRTKLKMYSTIGFMALVLLQLYIVLGDTNIFDILDASLNSGMFSRS